MSDNDRRYSDKDMKRILKRALELQAKSSSRAAPAGSDYSLNDLESVANEIGLPPELVRHAALELDTGSRKSGGSWFLGAETHVVAEQALPVGVDEERLDELLAAMPHLAEGAGSGNAHRTVLTWSSSAAEAMRRGFATEVSVRTGTEATTVAVRERLGGLAGGVFGGMMGGIGLGGGLGIGLGVGIGELQSALFATLVPLGSVLVSYGLARLIYTLIARGRKKGVNRILSRILGFLEPPGKASLPDRS